VTSGSFEYRFPTDTAQLQPILQYVLAVTTVAGTTPSFASVQIKT
jgi:hypothetical protein